jgi:hypothetical protein
MQTEPAGSTVSLPSIFDHAPPAERRPYAIAQRRKYAAWGSLLAISVGTGIAFAFGARKRSLAGGGVAALALGALRWQLARWFALAPAYEVIGHVGELELRRYPAYVEARTQVDTIDLESAIAAGEDRLACYIYGANARREDIAHTTPLLTSMRDGAYVTAFAMPPGHSVATLPQPDDLRVELREVPARDVAVLCFGGSTEIERIARYETALLDNLVEAGLSARGSVTFARYDSPTTLPLLRKNELWIEIV